MALQLVLLSLVVQSAFGAKLLFLPTEKSGLILPSNEKFPTFPVADLTRIAEYVMGFAAKKVRP